MELLPVEIQDKLLFPKYYKCNKDLTLNEKIYLSINLQNKKNISNQIIYLTKEFEYQCNRSDYNIWKRTKQPSYIFILYRCLVKKNKEHILNLSRTNNININNININNININYNDDIYPYNQS